MVATIRDTEDEDGSWETSPEELEQEKHAGSDECDLTATTRGVTTSLSQASHNPHDFEEQQDPETDPIFLHGGHLLPMKEITAANQRPQDYLTGAIRVDGAVCPG